MTRALNTKKKVPFTPLAVATIRSWGGVGHWDPLAATVRMMTIMLTLILIVIYIYIYIYMYVCNVM